MELKGLKTNYLGKNVKCYKMIDSTQLEILRQIENNIQNRNSYNCRYTNKWNRYAWQNMAH